MTHWLLTVTQCTVIPRKRVENLKEIESRSPRKVHLTQDDRDKTQLYNRQDIYKHLGGMSEVSPYTHH